MYSDIHTASIWSTLYHTQKQEKGHKKIYFHSSSNLSEYLQFLENDTKLLLHVNRGRQNCSFSVRASSKTTSSKESFLHIYTCHGYNWNYTSYTDKCTSLVTRQIGELLLFWQHVLNTNSRRY